MAYEMNDLKGILFLVLFAIPMIASTNINCNGKAFHCVNSTHFMICVDLGGGVSTTIDDFIIPCPATTVCHEQNIFECDFPKEEVVPPLQVYKQSDTSETTLVTDSVTTPMPISDIISEFQENVTTTTLPIPEEVTSVLKLEEHIKQPTKVDDENTTDKSFQVTSSFIDVTSDIVKDERINNNTIMISTTNNRKFDSPIENSTDKVPGSLQDQSKLFDAVNSTIAAIDLISDFPQNVAMTTSSPDVFISLDSLSANDSTTIDQNNIQQVSKHDDIVKNVTDEFNVVPENTFGKKSIITNEVSSISVNVHFENNTNDTTHLKTNYNLNNLNITNRNSIDEANSSSAPSPEITRYLTSTDVVNISESATEYGSFQTTTDKPLYTLGLDLISNIPSINSMVDTTKNSFYDNGAPTIDPYTIKQESNDGDRATVVLDAPMPTERILSENVIAANQISTTPTSNTEDITTLNSDFTESSLKITTGENVPKMNTTYFGSEHKTVASLQTSTESNIVPIITEDNILYAEPVTTTVHDSLVEPTSVDQTMEINITTDSPIELINSLYQIKQDFNQSLISANYNTSDIINATETINTLYSTSNSEPTLFLSTSTKYPVMEIIPPDVLQNELSAPVTDVINESTVTDYPNIVNEPKKETVENDSLLRIYKTPITTPDNMTTNLFNEVILKDLTTESDIVTREPTGMISEKNTRNTLDIYTPIYHGTTQKVITNTENTISDFLNPLDNFETTTLQDSFYTHQWTNTDQDQVGKTTINLNTNSATTSFPVNGIDNHKSNIITSENQDNNNAPNVDINFDILSTTVLPETATSNKYASETTSTMPEILDIIPSIKDSMKPSDQVLIDSLPNADKSGHLTTEYLTETSTTSQTDFTHNPNIENVSDLLIITMPPLDVTSQKTYTLLNNTSLTTDSDLISFRGIPADLNTSDRMESVNTETDISKAYSNNDTNGTDTVNPINAYTSDNITSSMVKNNTDKSIKIVSASNSINSSDAIPNGTLQPSNSNPLLSDNYIKTTMPQDSGVYVTTTDYNPVYNFAQVEEPVPKKIEDLQQYPKNIMDLLQFTTSTQTLPMVDTKTNNIKHITSTAAPLPSITNYEYINATKPNGNYVTEKIKDYIFSQEPILSKLNKLPNVDSQPSVNDVMTSTSILPKTLSSVLINDKDTIIDANGLSQTVPRDLKNDIKISQELPVLTSKPKEMQISKYYSEKPALLIPGFPFVKTTTDPTQTSKIFTLSTYTTAGRIDNDLPEIKITDLPKFAMTTENKNYSQSISDITTETVNLATEPDSMVETIKVDGGKVKDLHLGDTISNKIVSNIQTDNNTNNGVKTGKNIIDHESIVIRTIYKNNVLNKTTDSKIPVNYEKENLNAKSDLMKSNSNVDSAKIKDTSVEVEFPYYSVFTPESGHQNKTFSSNTPTIAQVEPKVSQIDHYIELTAITTNPLLVTKTEPIAPKTTQLKTINTEENKKEEINDSINVNNKTSDVKSQFRADLENKTDSYHMNNAKLNVTSYRNLSLQNSTFNDELEKHLISTNHTITTEVQSHLNESDKQSNKTSHVVTLNGTSTNNLNITSIKLNSDGKDNSSITVSASNGFNCSNRTRGKYADKKDCRKFYTCIGNLQPMIGTCPNNTVFSEINKQCTRNLSHCVRNNQFRCLLEGRFNDFFKDNIYYICVKNSMHGFIRYKLQCQGGFHLNKATVKCEKNVEIPSQSVSSISEANDESTTLKNKSEKLTTTDSFECESEGKFPYDKDCKKYYICTKIKNVYQWKIKKCASDEVYDKKKKKCVESDSGEC